jgi:hypothetical protein
LGNAPVSEPVSVPGFPFEVYYHRERQQCDFLIREKRRGVEAIQVTYEINDTNRNRELAGLAEAMRLQNLRRGCFLPIQPKAQKQSMKEQSFL